MGVAVFISADKMDSLPIIDFSTPDKDALARDIVQVMETVGFLYLDNVPGYNEEVEKELLAISKWFYSLPDKKRITVARHLYNNDNLNFFRGLFGLDKNYSSYKEGYEFGQDESTYSDYEDDPVERDEGYPLTEKNVWPEPDENDSDEEKQKYFIFKEKIKTHYNLMMKTSMEFLRLLAIGLELPDQNYFRNFFLPRNLSTLRIQHYPLRDFPTPSVAVEDDGQVVICGRHKDSVFLTFLITFQYTGLQVLLQDNKWLNVAPRPGSFVVNLGDTLSESTGGRIKATEHRVIETDCERFSLPFFLEPGFSSIIPRTLPLKGVPPESIQHIQYGPWVIKRMTGKGYAETKDLLEEFETRKHKKA